MTAGSDIADEVHAALIETGEATGDGALICRLKRLASDPGQPQTPWDAEDTAAGDPTLFDVTTIQDNQRIRDANGTLIGQTKRTLRVSATGVTPLKSNLIAVGVPAFGAHAGGWRLVGEGGPELEHTGPNRIYSNSQTRSMFDTSRLEAELRELRKEAAGLRDEAAASDRVKINKLRNISDLADKSDDIGPAPARAEL